MSRTAAAAVLIRSAISVRSSPMTSRSTVAPSEARRSASAAPDSSVRTPLATPAPPVRTRARVPGSSRCTASPATSALAADPAGGPIPGPPRGTRRRRASGHGRIRVPAPLAAPATGLRDDAEAPDLDAPFDTLDHVVDGEGGDRGGGPRL